MSRSTSRKEELRIATDASPDPTEEELAFLSQMGIHDVVMWVDDEKACAEYYLKRLWLRV